ncbi:extracellular solute-binding protein [Actinophytocola sp.]|uniref:ABC transporter substrate-binding protein n=1 Tax=Actinophytocola sp. TaxID=1872138 RepID=UPI003D6BBE0D
MQKKLIVSATAVLALSAAGACGSAEEGGSAPQDTNETVASVSAKLEGLSDEDRRAELIELAKAEGGSLNIYTSNPEESAQYAAEEFTNATGIEVTVYRAGAEEVQQKVVEEANADYDNQADVILNSDEAMYALTEAGVLEKFTTPASEGIPEETVTPEWIAAYFAPFVAAWNTDRTSGGMTGWKDFLTEYAGKLGMVNSDSDWFGSIVEIMMKEDGLTEEQAVQLFKDAAKGSQVVDGHTLVGTLLASGQIDATGSAYSFTINKLKSEGAPVVWEPPVLPIVSTFGAVAINKATDQPATSLLWIDWTLTDGMKLALEHDAQDPANPAYGGTLSKYLENGDIRIRDIKFVSTEADKWERLYQDVLRNAG